MSETLQNPVNRNPQDRIHTPGWRRILLWTVAGFASLILLTIVAGFTLLHSSRFHAYVLRTAQQKASTALGTNVKLQEFALHTPDLWNYDLDLYGLTVNGAAPYANSPLAQIQHMAVGLHVTSLLHRTWYLDNIRVDHPLLRVFIDPQGNNNIPHPPSNGSKSQTSIFDLGIRHALLAAGEIYYNDRKSVLDADLQNLSLQAAYDSTQTRYSGRFGYDNGHLQAASFKPIAHSLHADFDFTPTTFSLHQATLSSGHSQIMLNATADDYNTIPRVQADYHASLDATEMRQILNNPSLPLGIIQTDGTLRYQNVPNRTALDSVVLNGTLSSRDLLVIQNGQRLQITRLVARYTLANGNADVNDVRARLLGGELRAALTMRNITGDSKSHLSASLRGLSVADVKPFLPASVAQQVALGGNINADADASWGKTINDAVAATNATIQATVAPTANLGNRVPVDGMIHARYRMADKSVTFANSFVQLPQTRLNLNGTVSDRSALAVQLRTNDLHQLETIADLFRKPTPGQPTQALDLYGTASFDGVVRGSISAPHMTGQLLASNLRVRGSSWRMLRTSVDASPSAASLRNGELQPSDRGNITFNISAGLHQWSFTPSSPFQLALDASQLNVAYFAALAGAQTKVTGTLSAHVAAHGTESNPIGQGSIRLANASVADEPIQSVNLDFQGTEGEVRGSLALRIPAGGAQSTFSYSPKQKTYQVQLAASGVRLEQIKTLAAKNLGINGVLNLNANGQGTVDNPQLTASLAIPKLTVQKQAINNIKLNATVANHVAEMALDSQAIDTGIRGHAKVNLTGGYYTEANIDTQRIPLAPLLATYAPDYTGDLTGQTELHGTLHGPLKNKTALDAHLTIPVLQVNYQNKIQIGAPQPIKIDYTKGVIALRKTSIRGTDTDLQLQASVPITSNAPMSLLLLGNVDLGIAQLFTSDITSSGQLRFNINSYGQRADPNIQGQINVVNANFASGSTPVGLQNGNGVLTLTKDHLNITHFTGTVGGGEVTASGGVAYGQSLQFNLAMDARDIRLLYPEGMREGVSGTVTLTGTPQNAVLGGQVNLNELSFTPAFDLNSFVSQLSAGGTEPPPTEGFTQNLQLNLGVASTSGINLVSRTLSLQGTMNLRVRGTAAQPVILGRVNLNGGDLIFNGNRYVLQAGTLDFVNPVQTQPVVNIAVDTTIQEYNIHLRLNGPADHLQTLYASDPALPPADIINLLAFGRTQEASNANPTPGNLGAESLIASSVSSQVTNRIEKVAGISQLSINPVLAGSGTSQSPGANITVQQRVTGNLYVTFSTDVTSTQNTVIQGQYNLTPRVSLSATRDQNGGFGFDTLIKKSW